MDRLHVIYTPKGLAREYAELALNPFTGCRHACSYCYSPRTLHKVPERFHTIVEPRKDIIRKVEHDAAILEGDEREILLSFACDTYSPGADKNTTTAILRILLEHGLNINILTKGGNRALNDINLLKMYTDQVRFGTSIVFTNDDDAKEYEPNAASTSERCKTLHTFYHNGFKTWISLEPLWSEIDACGIIEKTHTFTDKYKIGKLNYHPHAEEVDWKYTINSVVKCCEDFCVDYHLKRMTARVIA